MTPVSFGNDIYLDLQFIKKAISRLSGVGLALQDLL